MNQKSAAPAATVEQSRRSNHFDNAAIDKGMFPDHISSDGTAYYADGTVLRPAPASPAALRDEAELHDAMERDAMIDTIKALEGEINAAWLAIERGWEIEPRSHFEEEAPKNGFESPLAMAVHYMWKRETKAPSTRAKAAAEEVDALRKEAELIAVNWAETLSEGEQDILLTSSLRRLRSMITAIIERCLSGGENEDGKLG